VNSRNSTHFPPPFLSRRRSRCVQHDLSSLLLRTRLAANSMDRPRDSHGRFVSTHGYGGSSSYGRRRRSRSRGYRRRSYSRGRSPSVGRSIAAEERPRDSHGRFLSGGAGHYGGYASSRRYSRPSRSRSRSRGHASSGDYERSIAIYGNARHIPHRGYHRSRSTGRSYSRQVCPKYPKDTYVPKQVSSPLNRVDLFHSAQLVDSTYGR
jgi:hypothetical protein